MSLYTLNKLDTGIDIMVLDTRSNKVRRSLVLRKASRYEVLVENPYVIQENIVDKFLFRLTVLQKDLEKAKRLFELRQLKGRILTSKEIIQEERRLRKLEIKPEFELIKYMIFMGSEVLSIVNALDFIQDYWRSCTNIINLSIVQSIRYRMLNTQNIVYYYLNRVAVQMKTLLVDRFRKKNKIKNINNIFEKFVVPYKDRHNIYITGLKFDGFYRDFEFIKFANGFLYNIQSYKEFFNKKVFSKVVSDVLEGDVKRTSIWGLLFFCNKNTYNGRTMLNIPQKYTRYYIESSSLYSRKNGGFFINVCSSFFFLRNRTSLKWHKYGYKNIVSTLLKTDIVKYVLDAYETFSYNMDLFINQDIRLKISNFLSYINLVIGEVMRYYLYMTTKMKNSLYLPRSLYLYKYIFSYNKMLLNYCYLLQSYSLLSSEVDLQQVYIKSVKRDEYNYVYSKKITFINIENMFSWLNYRDKGMNLRLITVLELFECILELVLVNFFYNKKKMYYDVSYTKSFDMKVRTFVKEYYKITEVTREGLFKIGKVIRGIYGKKFKYRKYLNIRSYIRSDFLLKTLRFGFFLKIVQNKFKKLKKKVYLKKIKKIFFGLTSLKIFKLKLNYLLKSLKTNEVEGMSGTIINDPAGTIIEDFEFKVGISQLQTNWLKLRVYYVLYRYYLYIALGKRLGKSFLGLIKLLYKKNKYWHIIVRNFYLKRNKKRSIFKVDYFKKEIRILKGFKGHSHTLSRSGRGFKDTEMRKDKISARKCTNIMKRCTLREYMKLKHLHETKMLSLLDVRKEFKKSKIKKIKKSKIKKKT